MNYKNISLALLVVVGCSSTARPFEDDALRADVQNADTTQVFDAMMKLFEEQKVKNNLLATQQETPVEQHAATPVQESGSRFSLPQSFELVSAETLEKFVNDYRFELAGVTAVVVISGTVYVLYKNGTLERLSDAIARHPRIAKTVIAVTTVAIAAAIAYYNGYRINDIKDIKLPEFTMPAMPEISMPTIKLPEFKLPKISLPSFAS